MSTVKIDGRHVAAARGLLKMTQEELAAAAGVNRDSVISLESGQRVTRAGTIEKIREALERRGIEFMNGDKPGVRLDPEKAIYPA